MNIPARLMGGFREFTKSDWDAFAGCEDKNPLICDDLDSVCIVIDGRSINVTHLGGKGWDDNDPDSIPIYAREFGTREEAHDVASAIEMLARLAGMNMLCPSAMANVLSAMLGGVVGTL